MANEEHIESVAKLYVKATENDWRTVQPAAQQAETHQQAAAGGEQATEQESAAAPSAENPATTAETVKMMNVARSILVNENGSVG